MYKFLSLLTIITATSMPWPAPAASKESTRLEVNIEKDADGNYTRETEYEHQDAVPIKDSEADLSADKDGLRSDKNQGDAKAISQGKLKGKTTTQSKTSIKKNPDGTKTYRQKKTVDGKLVEDKTTTITDE